MHTKETCTHKDNSCCRCWSCRIPLLWSYTLSMGNSFWMVHLCALPANVVSIVNIQVRFFFSSLEESHTFWAFLNGQESVKHMNQCILVFVQVSAFILFIWSRRQCNAIDRHFFRVKSRCMRRTWHFIWSELILNIHHSIRMNPNPMVLYLWPN